MPSIRQFLMDRKPDRAVLVTNPQNYSHHYFFFKSEGFNFLQIMEDDAMANQTVFNPTG
jgi:hypothetical protein